MTKIRKEEENDKYSEETDIHRNGRNGGFNKAICGSPQMRGSLGGGYSAAYGFNSDSHRIEKHWINAWNDALKCGLNIKKDLTPCALV